MSGLSEQVIFVQPCHYSLRTLSNIFFPPAADNQECAEHQECHEDADHFWHVPEWIHPELGEKSVPGEYLDGCPENDDSRNGHPDVRTPGPEFQFVLEHEYGANQTTDSDGNGDGVAFSQEDRVIDKHQQQVHGPHHDVQFHEGGNGSMMAHVAGDDGVAMFSEEDLLQPVERMAACL